MSVTAKPPRGAKKSWTAAARARAVAALPPEKLLADKQPSYVSSWIYVFGVLSTRLSEPALARHQGGHDAPTPGGAPLS